MSADLNASLALSKQQFDELIRLCPLEALSRKEYGSGAAKVRVEELLRKLNSLAGSIERALNERVSRVGEPPIVTLSAGHLSFYRDSLAPNAGLIRDAYFDISGFGELAGLLKGVNTSEVGTPIANAISWGVERWISMIDEDEKEDWLMRGFDLETAFDLVGELWFQPDGWRDNARLLQPILIDRPTQKIRDHVRYRLTEIYGAFIFGLWMAAIALSRSAVEFSILDNAHRLKIETTKINPKGEVEDKRLVDLIADVSRVRPALAKPLEAIRDTGNRILHPKKRDVIAFPKVRRQEALDCVKYTKVVLETLYSDSEYQGPSNPALQPTR